MGKSKATKPTKKQKVHIDAAGENPKDYLVLRGTDTELHLVKRGDGSRVNIKKIPPKEGRRR